MPFDAAGFVAGDSATAGARRHHGVLFHSVRRWFARRLREASNRRDPAATITILWGARALIEAGDWVQGAYVSGDRRCAIGALEAVGQSHGRRIRLDASAALFAVARAQGFESIERMNDSLSHDEVLAAFDLAIARVS